MLLYMKINICKKVDNSEVLLYNKLFPAMNAILERKWFEPGLSDGGPQVTPAVFESDPKNIWIFSGQLELLCILKFCRCDNCIYRFENSFESR